MNWITRGMTRESRVGWLFEPVSELLTRSHGYFDRITSRGTFYTMFVVNDMTDRCNGCQSGEGLDYEYWRLAASPA
jgi:hypothetical protein